METPTRASGFGWTPACEQNSTRRGYSPGYCGALGVVSSPLIRTHSLECGLRSETLLPVKDRTKTPVATPFSSPVMV